MRDHDHSTMSRDRARERTGDFRRDRERGAFFGSDREHERGPDRHGGWGGLMPDRERERSRHGQERDREPDRGGRGDRFGRERDPEFGSDAYHKGIPMDETRRLIASNKVEGTPVYGRDGDRLGTVHNFMVDKFSGEVVYAVLKSSGGFLGLGERYYPLDWDELTYDKRADGYCIDLTEDELQDRRSFDDRGREHRRGRGSEGRFESRDRRRSGW